LKIDPIYEKWIDSLDLTKSRIVRFPSLIFLCGGPTSEDSKGYKSCRDIFYKSIKNSPSCPFKDNLVLAEEIFRYFQHSSYKDLISFETDLAELSLLTVVFSESPGSIAEFGSFAVIKEIRERLLVVMHEEDANKESFVWRGPALFLKETAKAKNIKDPISIYNWQREQPEEGSFSVDAFSDVEDLSETIESIINNTPKSLAFNNSDPGHVMLLILDLLKMLNLATIEEITDILKHLGIDTNRQKIEQYISLLISLKYAVQKDYGHYTFYLSAPHKPWFSFTFKKGSLNNDMERWRFYFIDQYSTQQIKKHRALKAYMK